MSMTQTMRLRDLATIRHGGTPSKANRSYWQGGIPWVSPKDMGASLIDDSRDHISQEGLANSAASVVPPGSLLVVARSGILAHSLPVAITGRPVAFNQDIKAIIPDRTLAEPEYIYWYLRNHEREILFHGVKRGATVHSLQSGYLENLVVRLPPLSDQRLIVDILSRANGIRGLRREAQEKAGQLTLALFERMFGPDVQAGTLSVQALGDVSDVVSGVTKGRRLGAASTVVVPYLRVANVQAGFLDLSEVKTIEVLPSEVERLRLMKGDVLLTEGGDFDKLGRGALWESDLRNCIHQNHVFRVRVDRYALNEIYFVCYLQTHKARSYFLHSAKRTTNLASINMTQLRSLPVPLPTIQRQCQYAERVADIRAMIAQQDRTAEAAEALTKSLMARLFDGAAAA